MATVRLGLALDATPSRMGVRFRLGAGGSRSFLPRALEPPMRT